MAKSDNDPMEKRGKSLNNRNKPFHDPIAPGERNNGVFDWSFKAPSYDNRTSGSIPGGNYYGTGFRTPTGKFTASNIDKGPIPQTTKQFSPNEIFRSEDIKG